MTNYYEWVTCFGKTFADLCADINGMLDKYGHPEHTLYNLGKDGIGKQQNKFALIRLEFEEE